MVYLSDQHYLPVSLSKLTVVALALCAVAVEAVAVPRAIIDLGLGTNINIPGFASAPKKPTLIPQTALKDYRSQPRGVVYDTQGLIGCSWEYQGYLRGNGYQLYSASGNLDVDSVKQRYVGDCGFGAALLALKSVKADAALTNALQVTTGGNGDVKLVANLKHNSLAVKVYIDDSLPTLITGACASGVPSFQAPNNVLYAPLLEKAFAKFIDAYTDFSNTPTSKGYMGMEGIDAGRVMAAITGKTFHRQYRSKPGFDQTFANAFINCINGVNPCTIGTGDPKKTEELFGKGSVAPFGSAAVGAIANLTPNSDNELFTVTDYDMAGGPVDHIIVGQHWYALMKDKTKKVVSTTAHNTKNNEIVTLRNPWGCNPSATSGARCAAGSTSGEIQISLRALWTIARDVQWVA